MTFRNVRVPRHQLACHPAEVAYVTNSLAKEEQEVPIGNRCRPLQTRNLGIATRRCAHAFTNQSCIIVHASAAGSRKKRTFLARHSIHSFGKNWHSYNTFIFLMLEE